MSKPWTREELDELANASGSPRGYYRNAYALMSADDATGRDVRDFIKENAGAEIHLMPTSKAVEMHLEYLRRALPPSPSKTEE